MACRFGFSMRLVEAVVIQDAGYFDQYITGDYPAGYKF